MFYYATEFGMELCNWNLSSSLRQDSKIFVGSNCSRERCFECTYALTSSPSRTAPSLYPSITPELSSVVPTLFPTKTNSSAYVPTPSPTAVYRCEKANGKKFEYQSEKYSCKQLKKTKKKYRKRICMRVKRARNLCPVICKSKN